MKDTLGQMLLFAMVVLGGTLYKMIKTINALKQ